MSKTNFEKLKADQAKRENPKSGETLESLLARIGSADGPKQKAEFAARYHAACAAEGRMASTDPDGPMFQPLTPLTMGQRRKAPLDALPEWVTALVKSSAAVQCHDEAIPMMFALGALSIATCRTAGVNRLGGSPTTTNLYLACVADATEGKTPAAKAFEKPLFDFEKRLQDQWSIRRAKLQAKLTRLEQQKEEIEKEGGSITDDERLMIHKTAALVKLEQVQLFTIDSSPQELSSVVERNRQFQAVYSGEGGSAFEVVSNGSNGGATAFGPWLTGWSMDRMRVNRRDRFEDIPGPLMVAALGVQPDVLKTIADVKGSEGMGFVARWLYAWPPSLVGTRPARRPTPDTAAFAVWHERVTKLLERNWADVLHEFEQEVTDTSNDGPSSDLSIPVIRHSEAAQEHFEEWINKVEHQLLPGGRFGQDSSEKKWAGKMQENLFRVAGVLHMAHTEAGKDPTRTPSTERNAASTVALMDYFLEHGMASLGIMQDGALMGDCKTVVTWICEHPDRREVSARDLVSGCRAFKEGGDRPGVTLAHLELLGYVRRLAIGRRTVWVVRPNLDAELKALEEQRGRSADALLTTADACRQQPKVGQDGRRGHLAAVSGSVASGADVADAPGGGGAGGGCARCDDTVDGVGLCEVCAQAEREAQP